MFVCVVCVCVVCVFVCGVCGVCVWCACVWCVYVCVCFVGLLNSDTQYSGNYDPAFRKNLLRPCTSNAQKEVSCNTATFFLQATRRSRLHNPADHNMKVDTPICFISIVISPAHIT